MSEWISVEERLPPLDTKILCYCEYEWGGELQKNIHFGIYFGGDLFCVTDTFADARVIAWMQFGDFQASGTDGRFANAHVIAWMPLPKPPKGEESK